MAVPAEPDQGGDEDDVGGPGQLAQQRQRREQGEQGDDGGDDAGAAPPGDPGRRDEDGEEQGDVDQVVHGVTPVVSAPVGSVRRGRGRPSAAVTASAMSRALPVPIAESR